MIQHLRRIVGFEELGNEDNFPTSVLESRLLKTGRSSSRDVLSRTSYIIVGVIRKELEEDYSSPITYGTSSTTVQKHIRGGAGNQNADDDFEFDM